ncbi:uncharacterized protein LOC120477564 [Pimephales promelas]|uniref:uncharacterized protein LOC120477564 n=1 Tax=Pimephales promelas TaxID=90988 RepID=UPI0019556EC4|nr:uncharacterized protein LOC120477564 [Pimephales promelas]
MLTWEHILLLLKGTHKQFEMIEENETGMPSWIRTGDLLMRKIYKPPGPYHVGVYCGKHVIEFTAPENVTKKNQITSYSSNSESGTVNMKSVKNFIGEKQYRVVRLKTPIPENFFDSVDDAMEYKGIYHPLTNNCLHFALRLLGLEPGSIPHEPGPIPQSSFLEMGKSAWRIWKKELCLLDAIYMFPTPHEALWGVPRPFSQKPEIRHRCGSLVPVNC